ncbi:glycogen debranching protein GlgX [Derxia lacustris]|uniref:Glycogen debranching protein GlgX n=1 Tax=Derxia gummosa DSM 723 TaxID=1121388 RepID=A0AC36KJH4_9BURK|nr:glycogen debranching protein GlgX [Derxia gummosa]
MLLIPDRLLPGKPWPLGAHSDGLGINFAVFSANAERIDLCLFDPSGRRQIATRTLPECTDEVWHGYLPDARPGLVYGYRAWGAYDPANGQRFNPSKLLLDPYARRLAGTLRWSDVLFAYRVNSPRGDLSMDRRDSAPAMPKAVVTDDSFHWGNDRRPETPWSDTVIYELHPRGFTMLRDEIRADERGSFAALGDPRVIDHLRRLGITAVELMPVHAFVHDRFLVEKGLKNYWGYNTLGFFAPEPRYLSDTSPDELRIAIRRLHAAGIEVILDVVFNHSCEGSELGPTLSWRGLDNASYYRLAPDRRYYENDTGCGNAFNLAHPRVLQMVLDSLRYWVESFHVDGFRFDLCTTLGREAHGYDPGAGFFDAIRQDPVLAGIKMIAEPWDVGPGGYQLGNLPPGFAEWNDRFRDSLRRYWRGDGSQRPELAARLAGSGDLLDRRLRRPWASINYIASHDGFTLHDLVSHAHKHNEANGEDNRDGHGDNCSANWGFEGVAISLGSGEPEHEYLRRFGARDVAVAGEPPDGTHAGEAGVAADAAGMPGPRLADPAGTGRGASAPALALTGFARVMGGIPGALLANVSALAATPVPASRASATDLPLGAVTVLRPSLAAINRAPEAFDRPMPVLPERPAPAAGQDDDIWDVRREAFDVIARRREAIKRAMLMTVFCALGTPMLLAGDEFGRSQRGNNNAYCQDNEISWVDWSLAQTPAGRALTRYVARLIELRQAHPSLRARQFLHARTQLAPGLPDIAWFDERGGGLSVDDWNNPEGRALGLRRAVALPDGRIDLTLLLLNSSPEPLAFRLPAPDVDWEIALDSAHPSRPAARLAPVDPVVAATGGRAYELARHASALLVATLVPEVIR